MGKNSRHRRRTADQRRTKTSDARTGAPPDSAHTGPSPREDAEFAVVTAAQLAAAGFRDRGLPALLELDRSHPAQVDDSVASLLERLVESLWPGGWQPGDLAAITRHKLDPPAGPLLARAIRAEHRRYPSSTIDPRWGAQLDGLEAADPDGHWSVGLGSRPVALEAAIGLAGLLLTLPQLPRLLPLPGSATASCWSASAVDDKMLGRIRGLLAKAEATEFPEEAEALSDKAQALMARFSLDRAMVEAAAPDRIAAAGRRVWVEAPYASAKLSLVAEVAAANRCRTVQYDRLGFVTVIGDEVDLQLTDVLATSLMVQASRAMVEAGRQAHGYSRTRSYRHAFLLAYAVRIGERLRETARTTEAEAARADGGLLPVLAARKQRVEALFADLFPRTVVRERTISNGAGWIAGRAAADRAALDTRRPVGAG